MYIVPLIAYMYVITSIIWYLNNVSLDVAHLQQELHRSSMTISTCPVKRRRETIIRQLNVGLTELSAEGYILGCPGQEVRING